MAALHACASWRYGGLRSQTTCPSLGMRLDTPSRPMRSFSGRHGYQAAPGSDGIHVAAGQLMQAAVHVAEPAATMSPAAFDEHSQQSESYSASGQLLLKSLTWSQLEGWCAANGARHL